MKIGVIVSSFNIPFWDSVTLAKEMGAHGIQMHAVSGETTPDNLDASQRQTLKKKIEDTGLEIAAICGDFWIPGFMSKEENPSRIEKTKKIIDLTKDLGCNIITTHIGIIPEDTQHPRYRILQDACAELHEYTKKADAFLAIETGPEESLSLRNFLETITPTQEGQTTPNYGLAINFDPANLRMVQDEDSVSAVKNLAPYIVHTHAKDGTRLKEFNPARLYHPSEVEDEKISEFEMNDYFIELPLGEGDVHFKTYIDALHSISYDGYLTIEREVGDNPIKDIQNAIAYLKDILK